MKIVSVLDKISEKEIELYGNKAKNLWLMQKEGINVPDAIAIMCSQAWNNGCEKERVLEISEKMVKEYFQHNTELIVRSSFKKEDSEDSSMAGIFESVRINSHEQIRNAICQVWESARGDWTQMGIIIQPYIDCDFSGIMFSASPYDGGENVVIEFTKGECCRLVKGDFTPDLYVFSKGWIRSNPQYVTEKILQRLICLEKRMRLLMKTDIDVEFCVNNDSIYILQCRPMTTGKKKKPLYMGKSVEGTWLLHEELSLPFTPLVRTLDPSGLLTERPHIIFENYAYFSSEFRLKSVDDEKWKDWETISEHYSKIFFDILNKKSEADFELLEYAVCTYRNSVEAYMNVNWFIYRRKSYEELIDALKNKYHNYQDIFFGVMHSIETVNTAKKKDFIELLKLKGNPEFKEKKEAFVKKYGAETSHPFYIMCKSLEDYIDQIIEVLSERKICDKVNAPINITDKFDPSLCILIEKYRKVVQRTEDDDYLLCLGSYVIRKILEHMEKRLQLEKNTIWFYEYSELKELGCGIKISTKIIEERRKSFEHSKNYDMPLAVKNGLGVYSGSIKENTLEGDTISQGYAKGKVYVLKNPGDILEIVNIPNGSIVYSNWISPILSAYFFNIKGIIVPERSILSHGAILAREMRIPAVGGIQYNFKNGTEIELNATEGKVFIK